MLNNIRIRMLTLLVIKLPNIQENRLSSSHNERTVLERTKLMPDPVQKQNEQCNFVRAFHRFIFLQKGARLSSFLLFCQVVFRTRR